MFLGIENFIESEKEIVQSHSRYPMSWDCRLNASKGYKSDRYP